MMDWGGMWGGGNWFMFLTSIVVLVAVIVGIVFLVRGLSGGGATSDQRSWQPQRESAEELLRHRYAAGEIDREEYQQKLRDLRA